MNVDDDDEDWVGTPPEGHVARERSDPSHWTRPWRAQTVVYALIGVGIAIVVVLALVAN
jgi:hypothetical protein